MSFVIYRWSKYHPVLVLTAMQKVYTGFFGFLANWVFMNDTTALIKFFKK